MSELITLIFIFLIDFLIGLVLIIRSKIINNWIFTIGTRLVKGSWDTPYTEGERQMSLWTLRVVGVFLLVAGVLPLYILFSDFH
jgi:hypothetical protein